MNQVADGVGEAAARLREAFGEHAEAVARRWAGERDDLRWLKVAERIKSNSHAGAQG